MPLSLEGVAREVSGIFVKVIYILPCLFIYLFSPEAWSVL